MFNAKKGNLFIIKRGAMLFTVLASFIIASPAFAVDSDFDGIDDTVDNCPNDSNPNQYDFDKDGIGNVCDVGVNDADNDGVDDASDNCPNDANPRQYDSDHDGTGNVCETFTSDADGDMVEDATDNCPDDANPRQFDLDNDGIGTVCDPDESLVKDAVTINRVFTAEQGQMDAFARILWAESTALDSINRTIEVERNSMAMLIRQRNVGGPIANCPGCHASAIDRSSHEPPLPTLRQITGGGSDFSNTSHHKQGNVEDLDCLSCHYTGNHGSGIVNLVNGDDTTVIPFTGDYQALEPFCLACHDANGAYAYFGAEPFRDGVKPRDVTGSGLSMWAGSAHENTAGFTCLGDGTTNGCHVENAHGSSNDGLMALAGNIEVVCSTCHTNYHLNGHPVNQTKVIGADTFTVTCITCHNPHRVQYGVGANKMSEPDFSDPVNNPHAMGFTLSQHWICLNCHDY